MGQKIFLFVLFFTAYLFGDTQTLTPFKQDNKWGFKNSQGTVIVPAVYDATGEFTEGLAPVKRLKKFGYIDGTGREVIPFKFDDARSFQQGVAFVKVQSLWGIINKSGQFISPPRYKTFSYADLLLHGIAMVEDTARKVGFVNRAGREVIPLKYDDASRFADNISVVSQKGKYGAIDTTGREIVKLQYANLVRTGKIFAANAGGSWKHVDLFFYDEGEFSGGKWGFLDLKGNELTANRFDWYQHVPAEKRIYVGIGGTWNDHGKYSGGKYGIFSENGGELLPPKYNYVGPFTEGISYVNENCTFDSKGQPVGGDWAAVNSEGKMIIPAKKYSSFQQFHEGLAAVERDGKFGFVDITGKEVVPLKYDGVRSFERGKAVVNYGVKWDKKQMVDAGKSGLIDKTGRVVLPVEHDDLNPYFADRIYWAKKNRKFAFFSNDHRQLTEFIFDNVTAHKDGCIFVNIGGIAKENGETEGGRWGALNMSAAYIIEPGKYDEIDFIHEGRIRVKKDQKYGFVDNTGREVIPLRYDSAEPFKNGKARVKAGEKEFYIGKTGTAIP